MCTHNGRGYPARCEATTHSPAVRYPILHLGLYADEAGAKASAEYTGHLDASTAPRIQRKSLYHSLRYRHRLVPADMTSRYRRGVLVTPDVGTILQTGGPSPQRGSLQG